MKQKLLRKSLAAFVWIFLSCTGSGLEEIFIPNLSNLWFSDERNSSFTFTQAQENVNESTFTGVEHDDDTAEDYNLSGSFKNYDISFTYSSGPEAGKTYSGQFVKDANPQRMLLKRKDDATKTMEMHQN